MKPVLLPGPFSLRLTESAAIEYAARGIRINAVCPGLIRTPMAERMTAAGQAIAVNAMLEDVPIGRLGRAEEIADLCFGCAAPRQPRGRSRVGS